MSSDKTNTPKTPRFPNLEENNKPTKKIRKSKNSNISIELTKPAINKQEKQKSLDGQAGQQTKEIETQNNGKSTKCPYCGKLYTNKYSMHTHLKSLHKIKPHQCEVCQESFWEIKEQKEHMEKFHIQFLVQKTKLEKQNSMEIQQKQLKKEVNDSDSKQEFLSYPDINFQINNKQQQQCQKLNAQIPHLIQKNSLADGNQNDINSKVEYISQMSSSEEQKSRSFQDNTFERKIQGSVDLSISSSANNSLKNMSESLDFEQDFNLGESYKLINSKQSIPQQESYQNLLLSQVFNKFVTSKETQGNKQAQLLIDLMNNKNLSYSMEFPY